MVNLDRWKVFIICGFIITLVVFALPFVLKKRPLIMKASRYIYLKRKEGYQLILYFDRQGKLWEAMARFNSPSGTIDGIKFGASERGIDAKLGNRFPYPEQPPMKCGAFTIGRADI
jgi:hypothetical protein